MTYSGILENVLKSGSLEIPRMKWNHRMLELHVSLGDESAPFLHCPVEILRGEQLSRQQS